MKKNLFLFVLVLFSIDLNAQVTQINNNKSLQFNYPLSTTKSLYVSGIDQTLWATDGTLAGTIQLSSTIHFVEPLGSIVFGNGKYIFSGTTTGLGAEVYITDGTPAGTVLVKDINPGATSSNPGLIGILPGFIYFTATTPGEGDELWKTDGTTAGTTLVKDINPGLPGSSIGFDVAYLNNFLYFTATTVAEGRELWRTDGSVGGTTLVKDIVPGNGDSNYPDNYELTSTSTYLLFMARTPASGVELWRSDGTGAGTILLKDINPGPDSSNARGFSILNNRVLFQATDAAHGDEIWVTDGSTAGTTLLSDINPGTGSSTGIAFSVGPFTINYPIFLGFHIFNNHAFFNANDGTSAGEVWSTDGTSANTILIKNIIPKVDAPPSFLILLPAALNLPNKFIFTVTDADSPQRSELWESDGTPMGTKLFKTFSGAVDGGTPTIFPPSFSTNNFSSPQLFQGNKFFFRAATDALGTELWVSDGVDSTPTHTHVVKDINPGAVSSSPGSSSLGFSFLYTSSFVFFPAMTATNGVELWKSDGSASGTTLVQDIITGIDSANPHVDFLLVNGHILFEATDGDDPDQTDLFAVDGIFTPLPVKLTDFTVSPKNGNALLQWNTAQELNTKVFKVQRSKDGQHFEDIGTVQAAGTTSNRHTYSFIDPGIINSGLSIIYYRLLTVDKDGKAENSNVISLRLTGNGQWNVHLLSNPVHDNINLILSGIQGRLQLAVFDINGKMVYTRALQNVNGLISLPLFLQKGVYILSAENNGENKSIKFVK